MLFVLLFLSFICNLLFKIFIEGIYFVINGIPRILCFISVKWTICLEGLFRKHNLFHCSGWNKV